MQRRILFSVSSYKCSQTGLPFHPALSGSGSDEASALPMDVDTNNKSPMNVKITLILQELKKIILLPIRRENWRAQRVILTTALCQFFVKLKCFL